MLRVYAWDEWQSFRKDRGTPPWIKVHRNLFSNRKWASLSDAEKGQLVSIWLVAADTDGFVPDDATVLRKICQLDEAPNLSKFKELGLLCQPSDNQLTTTCQPSDAPETEVEGEIEVEGEAITHKPSSIKKIPPSPARGRARGGRVFGNGKWEGAVWSRELVEYHLSTDALSKAKQAAPGWDIYRLMETYAGGISDGTRPPPENLNAAFPAWCRSYTKGKRP